jgi:hypothetical protein
MPSSTMQDEPEYKLPKETLFPAMLKAVSEREIKFTNKKGEPDTFYKWEWEFEITDGEYAGLRAWGDTEDRLTNREDNKVRQWAETLRGAPFEMGEGLNTDDLLGLECVITVDNVEHQKKDGSGKKSYLCPVIDVYPAEVLASGVTSAPGTTGSLWDTGEPPF